jgi:hypothetical protein
MPIKRIKVRNTETGDVVEVSPAAAGYFAGFEPVEEDKPADTPAPADNQPAAKKKTAPAADTTKEQ